ncbi:hypothetical protein KIN20_011137, partial [Parelaphostrongylus tenuis]
MYHFDFSRRYHFWRTRRCRQILEQKASALNGHTYSMWASAAIECTPGFYLTRSADRTIKLWRNDNVIKSVAGTRSSHSTINGTTGVT